MMLAPTLLCQATLRCPKLVTSIPALHKRWPQLWSKRDKASSICHGAKGSTAVAMVSCMAESSAMQETSSALRTRQHTSRSESGRGSCSMQIALDISALRPQHQMSPIRVPKRASHAGQAAAVTLAALNHPPSTATAVRQPRTPNLHQPSCRCPGALTP